MPSKQLAEQAVATFGGDEQIRLMQEEAAELIAALNQHRRMKIFPEDVITEIADVFIMAEQMRILFGRERVDDEILRKEGKLRLLVEQKKKAVANVHWKLTQR